MTLHCALLTACDNPKSSHCPSKKSEKIKGKMEKMKSEKVFLVKFNSQRVNLDLPVTQKTKPRQSKQERKTNQENNLFLSGVANFVIGLIVKCRHKSIPLASLRNQNKTRQYTTLSLAFNYQMRNGSRTYLLNIEDLTSPMQSKIRHEVYEECLQINTSQRRQE